MSGRNRFEQIDLSRKGMDFSLATPVVFTLSQSGRHNGRLARNFLARAHLLSFRQLVRCLDSGLELDLLSLICLLKKYAFYIFISKTDHNQTYQNSDSA